MIYNDLLFFWGNTLRCYYCVRNLLHRKYYVRSDDVIDKYCGFITIYDYPKLCLFRNSHTQCICTSQCRLLPIESIRSNPSDTLIFYMCNLFYAANVFLVDP